MLVHANEAAARIVGFPSVNELLRAPLAEVMQRFESFDANGAPFAVEGLPNRTLLLGGVPEKH